MMNYYKIILEEVHIYTQIGVNDDEKIERDFFLNIEVVLDLGEKVKDDLLQTVNTKDIQNAVRIFVKGKKFNLIEYIASGICDEVLLFKKVKSCKVILNKPKCLKFTKNIVVEVYKTKK